MKMVMMAAALVVTAGPAVAAGRIACESDARDIVNFSRANPQVARQVTDFSDRLEVAVAQCHFDWGRAQANLDSLEQDLGMAGRTPQFAYQPDFPEWPNPYD